MNNCSIQYTTEYSYENLTHQVIGPINTPFPIISLEEVSTVVYYHQATIVVNTSISVVVRARDVFFTYSSTSHYASQTDPAQFATTFPSEPTIILHRSHLGLIVAVIAVLLLGLTVSIIFIIFLVCKGKHVILSKLLNYEFCFSVKRLPSSPCSANLPRITPIHYVYTSNLKLNEMESKAVEDDVDADSVVYEEVRNFVTRPFVTEAIPRVNTASEIELTVNSAYPVLYNECSF